MTAREWHRLFLLAAQAGAFGRRVEEVSTRQVRVSVLGTTRSIPISEERFDEVAGGWLARAIEILGPIPEGARVVDGWARARRVGKIVGNLLGKGKLVEEPR